MDDTSVCIHVSTQDQIMPFLKCILDFKCFDLTYPVLSQYWGLCSEMWAHYWVVQPGVGTLELGCEWLSMQIFARQIYISQDNWTRVLSKKMWYFSLIIVFFNKGFAPINNPWNRPHVTFLNYNRESLISTPINKWLIFKYLFSQE